MVSMKVSVEETDSLCNRQVIISTQRAGGAAWKRGWDECGGIGPGARFTVGATASHSGSGRHEGEYIESESESE
jgi:hypothetical protein